MGYPRIVSVILLDGYPFATCGPSASQWMVASRHCLVRQPSLGKVDVFAVEEVKGEFDVVCRLVK
jgi:hypothetical protein